MNGIDGGSAAHSQSQLQPFEVSMPDEWDAFAADFFVEWQVPEEAARQGEGQADTQPI